MSETKNERKYGFWYEFGKYTETGNVDINTSITQVEVLTNVKSSEAENVIKLHNAMVAELDELTGSEPQLAHKKEAPKVIEEIDEALTKYYSQKYNTVEDSENDGRTQLLNLMRKHGVDV